MIKIKNIHKFKKQTFAINIYSIQVQQEMFFIIIVIFNRN
ncbi:hypothetical protein IFVP182_C2130005 [Vibrio parahaemolyticus]